MRHWPARVAFGTTRDHRVDRETIPFLFRPARIPLGIFPRSLKNRALGKAQYDAGLGWSRGYPAGLMDRSPRPLPRRLLGWFCSSASLPLSTRCDWTTCFARHRLAKAVKLERCQSDRATLNASWRVTWRATIRRPARTIVRLSVLKAWIGTGIAPRPVAGAPVSQRQTADEWRNASPPHPQWRSNHHRLGRDL
jgi:hypothetical protein